MNWSRFFISLSLLILTGVFWNIDKWMSVIYLLTVVLLNVPPEEN